MTIFTLVSHLMFYKGLRIIENIIQGLCLVIDHHNNI